MYNIVNWDTNEIIAKVSKLSTAKRLCRNQGHTGQSNGAYYAPVARAQDDNGFCVYNPKFRAGKHDHLKAETFVIAISDDGETWKKLDTRGSLNAAITLAKNTNAPVVAVFKAAGFETNTVKARFVRDNRDKTRWPIRSAGNLINSKESDWF